MRNFQISISIIFLIIHSCFAQLALEFESGRVSSGYNDVRIPGDKGTRFSLTTDLQDQASVFFRSRVNWQHENLFLSLLYAPLTIESRGQITRPIRFQDTVFAENTNLDATYRFNSYRLTIRYLVYRSPTLKIGLGGTAKIRDAEITLTSSDQKASKSNVGGVPLINFYVHWQMHPRIGLLFRGDALAAPQGRAEDVLLALTTPLSETLQLRAGYRLLEGGADNDEVYSFALLHYILAGLTWQIEW
jgi:hypothetical protein